MKQIIIELHDLPIRQRISIGLDILLFGKSKLGFSQENFIKLLKQAVKNRVVTPSGEERT